MTRRRETPGIEPFVSPVDTNLSFPAVAMFDPRYPHNVGAAVRAASCFGLKQVWLQGTRVANEVWASKRLPREERMKGFSDVEILLEDRPFEHFPSDAVPVAIELLPGSENLFEFEHPEKAIYIFGPEDGGVPRQVRGMCHRRVFIPTLHCTNLAAAVYLVLYDRAMKEWMAGTRPALTIQEQLASEYRPALGLGWPSADNPVFEEAP